MTIPLQAGFNNFSWNLQLVEFIFEAQHYGSYPDQVFIHDFDFYMLVNTVDFKLGKLPRLQKMTLRADKNTQLTALHYIRSIAGDCPLREMVVDYAFAADRNHGGWWAKLDEKLARFTNLHDLLIILRYDTHAVWDRDYIMRSIQSEMVNCVAFLSFEWVPRFTFDPFL